MSETLPAVAPPVHVHVPKHVATALALRLEGYSWRAVADKMGRADHMLLYRECRAYDSAIRGDERYQALRQSVLEVAQEAVAQTQEALLNHEIQKTQLPIVMGIAVDKVVKFAQAERPREPAGAVADLLSALQGSGGSLKLELSVPPTLTAEIVSDSEG